MLSIASSVSRANAGTTTLRVLFFGPVRERLGIGECQVPCTNEISTDDLWVQLIERFPTLAPLRPTVRLARNGEFLREDEVVRSGDEIALIPPVSGG
jgi:molybdopterin converting factor subunit 1